VEQALDRHRFVDVLRIAVQDQAATGTINLLSKPPGRKPADELAVLSAWFTSLAPQDRQNVERVIEMTAADATFGILCILDGVRAIVSIR
jgi:streptomycin 6-kinase